jgi:heptosyltransferase-2
MSRDPRLSLDIRAKPWNRNHPPDKILVIRFHAFGDTIITLPYIQGLAMALPHSKIDFMTVNRVGNIPRAIELFHQVHTVKGRKNLRRISFWSMLKLPALRREHYDVVIDLQNNSNSRRVRSFLKPEAWAEFDRFAPVSAGERNHATISAVGFPLYPEFGFRFKHRELGKNILKQNGLDLSRPVVVLNPAGYFPTRNWPLERYAELARIFLGKWNADTQFLILGVNQILQKATYLEKMLHPALINLVGKTNQVEAFAILQYVDLVISEDSGLMHMAWTSGVPTLALFGSTRSDWARPVGKYTDFLDSSDLPCGNCMSATCIYGDVHCLSRYPAELVFDKAMEILRRKSEIFT